VKPRGVQIAANPAPDNRQASWAGLLSDSS
jgi:hypothetical protein